MSRTVIFDFHGKKSFRAEVWTYENLRLFDQLVSVGSNGQLTPLPTDHATLTPHWGGVLVGPDECKFEGTAEGRVVIGDLVFYGDFAFVKDGGKSFNFVPKRVQKVIVCGEPREAKASVGDPDKSWGGKLIISWDSDSGPYLFHAAGGKSIAEGAEAVMAKLYEMTDNGAGNVWVLPVPFSGEVKQ